jgi:hypothetical protein
MPETAMHKDHLASTSTDHIWRTGQIAPVEAISNPELCQKTPYLTLRSGIGLANAAHHARARQGRNRRTPLVHLRTIHATVLPSGKGNVLKALRLLKMAQVANLMVPRRGLQSGCPITLIMYNIF